MDHIGIDVHKSESQICLLAEGGKLIELPRALRECRGLRASRARLGPAGAAALADRSALRGQRLRTVPSVGSVTAAAFVATIDDVQRFHHAPQLEASLGLVPREFSSGDGQHRGAITKAGPGRTRWLLIQAAVSILLRRPPEAAALCAWALRIAARRGKQIAVVAPARRPAGILYARLRDGTVFTPRRPSPTVVAVTLPGGVTV